MATEHQIALLIVSIAKGTGYFKDVEIEFAPELAAKLQHVVESIEQGNIPTNLRPLLHEIADAYAADCHDRTKYPAGKGIKVLSEWNEKVKAMRPRVPPAKLDKQAMEYWEMAIGHLAAANARMTLSRQLWTATSHAFQVLARGVAGGAPDPMVLILASCAANAYKIAYENSYALEDDMIEIEHGYVCAKQEVDAQEEEQAKTGGISQLIEEDDTSSSVGQVWNGSTQMDSEIQKQVDWDDPDVPMYQPEPLSFNPANGLPMINQVFDVAGNTFGTDFN